MLEKLPEDRIGTKLGKKAVMEHPWFDDIDWKALETLKLKSPYTPKVDETNNFEFFDPEFTQEGSHSIYFRSPYFTVS